MAALILFLFLIACLIGKNPRDTSLLPSTQGNEMPIYIIPVGLESTENTTDIDEVSVELPLPDYEHPPAYETLAKTFEIKSITMVEYFL
ncbi:unnamed protein product [Allacma fusca]|uniref:Uncharacterized protein n=1 Tax=Allacma fusca TaxID=39272 RepID=A0A8J2JMN6_9HEXA|nr:unnamed protein product [Allacma fusca]